MSPIVSSNQLIHFLQLHLSGRFQQFDYGLEENMARYHQASPPEYELKNVTSPTYIYHAMEDLIVVKSDVDHLTSLLPNVQLYRTIENWNHLDFIMGKNSRKVLYENIVQSLKSS
jgi:predicted alpha/beta-fold hydrolase